ncbi:MAG: hypothetical protein HQM13_05085 [SAR324 cluster bacterium]|nr:hypothetical protein [SAR324 cluster bacterium]
MKPIDSSKPIKDLGPCPRCRHPEVLLFHSEKVDGYYVSECEQCGAYSEIMSADVFQLYRPQKPRKTGDQNEPWLAQLSPRHTLSFTDRRTSIINKIFKKIKDKKKR